MCRTVLIVLGMSKLEMAAQLAEEFKFLETPLYNFTKFLIQAVEAKEATLVSVLKERYAKSLQRDPELEKYLERVQHGLSEH